MFWKKLLICGMIILIMTGCGNGRGDPIQKALDLRTALLEAGGCTFIGEIRADYGDRVYDFTVSCDYTAGEQAKICVLQPEEISGISATVSQGNVRVNFDGTALDFGTLAQGNVSALEAPWLLGECWIGSYISSAGDDGELFRFTCLEGFEDDELVIDTWLDSSGNPVHGEIAYDGVRCLTFEITQFQLNDEVEQ